MSNHGWTEDLILHALAANLGYRQQTLIPQADFAGGILDLLAISNAGYAVEYEIKVTLADWNADGKKKKWSDPDRRFIKRLVYAIPEHLESKIPDWLGPEVGVLVVRDTSGVWTRVVRTGSNNPDAQKLSDASINRLIGNMYYRYWDDLIVRLRSKRDSFDRVRDQRVRLVGDNFEEFRLEGKPA